MKKIFFYTILAGTFFGITMATDQTQNNPSGFGDTSMVHGYGVAGTQSYNGSNGDILITKIQDIINWILGLLSLIALILCLRGGFQMLTAGGDDGKVKKGFKVLKNAAIGLAVIGISWLIISFVFWLIQKFAGGVGT